MTALVAGGALSPHKMLCFENNHRALIANLIFSLFLRHNALFSLLFALAGLHVTQGSSGEYNFLPFRISFVWASFLTNPQLITLRWWLPRMKEHLCACCILALTYHLLGTQLSYQMKYNKQFWPLLPSGDALPPSEASGAWVGQSGSFSSLWVLGFFSLFYFFSRIVSKNLGGD